VRSAVRFAHAFVDEIPEALAERMLYVSIPFRIVVHLCACGCRREVVTPIQPNRWRLTFDGETVSRWPSIGRWATLCQSHYWIRRSEIRWSRRWSSEEIAASQDVRRRRDRRRAGLLEEPAQAEPAQEILR
jgi:hypothetical protein